MADERDARRPRAAASVVRPRARSLTKPVVIERLVGSSKGRIKLAASPFFLVVALKLLYLAHLGVISLQRKYWYWRRNGKCD